MMLSVFPLREETYGEMVDIFFTLRAVSMDSLYQICYFRLGAA